MDLFFSLFQVLNEYGEVCKLNTATFNDPGGAVDRPSRIEEDLNFWSLATMLTMAIINFSEAKSF